ncbi:MAG TPA: hypothetical protein VJ870_11975 [Amycolatopsis sp.]|nr:hypothetical protein [Amycolatopsis sp.]
MDAPDEVRAVGLGGIDTAVHRWGDSDGRPVVMLHSLGLDLGLDGASFGFVAAALTRQAPILVLAPDLRGHGRSRAAPEQVEVRGMAADVVELGQSLGTPALHVFLERPDACAQALLDGWERPASRFDRDIRRTRIRSARPYR